MEERRVLTLPARPSAPSAAPKPVAPFVPPTLATDDAPPLHLPGTHFAFASTTLLLGAAGLVLIAPELAAGSVFAPRLLAVVHLFTLGWITTSILGALYQFLPVAVGTPIRSQTVAYITLALHAVGLALFVAGLLMAAPAVFRTGALLVAAALALFALNLALSLARATQRDVTFWVLSFADFFLVATLVLGGLLAWNLHSGRPLGADRLTVLAVHIHVALVGWVLMVMVGVAHRLLPMFLLSHGASERPAQVSVGMLALGSGLLLLPVSTAGRAVAGMCIVLGVVAFLVQAASFYRHRRRRALDPGMRLAYCGLFGLAMATLAAPFALREGLANPRLLVTYLLVALVGAISTFIAGHYYKIVPFLIWYHRFGPLIGERPVPKVADLFSANVAKITVAVLALGTWTMVAGLALSSGAMVRGGALVFGAAVTAELAQMIGISRRRPT